MYKKHKTPAYLNKKPIKIQKNKTKGKKHRKQAKDFYL